MPFLKLGVLNTKQQFSNCCEGMCGEKEQNTPLLKTQHTNTLTSLAVPL